MTDKPENPPAFPTLLLDKVDNVEHGETQGGMTLRDYFIAHAPVEPQPWFVPTMPLKPELPDPYTELSEEDLAEWRKLDEFAPEEGNERVKAFCQREQDARKARQEWENERKKQRYAQWPAAWADAMLKARAA